MELVLEVIGYAVTSVMSDGVITTLITVLWNTLDTNIFLFLLSIFLNFIFFFLLNFFFFFFFFLVMMKRHVTLQSHDLSHDVMS